MLGLLLSALWYIAILLLLIACIALIRPIPRLRLPNRRRAAGIIAVCLAIILVVANTAPAATTVTAPTTKLDDFAPTYHYTETHSKLVDATPERVFAAMKEVTADEIALFRAFVNIRRFGQPGPESILNPSASTPILDVATRTTFLLLAEAPPRELVVGTIVAAPPGTKRTKLTPDLYRALNAPGFVKATMHFLIEPSEGGSRLTTETRVYGTDAHAIRRFTPYWRTIYPGSWILRITWLNAIAQRAQRAAGL